MPNKSLYGKKFDPSHRNEHHKSDLNPGFKFMKKREKTEVFVSLESTFPFFSFEKQQLRSPGKCSEQANFKIIKSQIFGFYKNFMKNLSRWQGDLCFRSFSDKVK